VPSRYTSLGRSSAAWGMPCPDRPRRSSAASSSSSAPAPTTSRWPRWTCNCLSGLCRLCRGASGRRRRSSHQHKREPAPVILHVYDMGGDEVAKRVNEVFRPLGLGAFHGAVEVYGREWSFGQTEEGSGIFSCEPKGCPEHTYRESVSMGETMLSRREVRDLLKSLEWPGLEYDLLRHNCCHWCDEFCKRLGVGPIPAWVNQLAGEVASLDDGMKKIDDGMRKAAANAKAVIDDARSKTVRWNTEISRNIEAKADEIRENVGLIQHNLEEKTSEIRGNVEAGLSEFMTKVEEVDKKFKRSMTEAAENIQKETNAALDLLRHSTQSHRSSQTSGMEVSSEASPERPLPSACRSRWSLLGQKFGVSDESRLIDSPNKVVEPSRQKRA